MEQMENPNQNSSEEMDPLAMIEEAMAMVESYIEKPEEVTAETLGNLRDELGKIREVFAEDEDIEDSGETSVADDTEEPSGPMASIMSKGKQAMKGAAMAAAFILFGLMNAHARRYPMVGGLAYPQPPSMYMTDTVYYSSVTCASKFEMQIATRSSQLGHITVTQPGSPGSWFSVWDARISTGGNAAIVGSSRPATVAQDWWFKTGTSSGIVVNVETKGGSPVCLDIWHFEK